MGGIELAGWIRQTLNHPVTHLKLQKLVFYAYGAAVAHGVAAPLGTIQFRAWKHGPVCKQVWDDYKGYGGSLIPPPAAKIAEPYPPWTAWPLHDALTVYDLLGAWDLREQSHLEEPWIAASKAESEVISGESIRGHFIQKFAGNQVRLPERLRLQLSFSPDGIPVLDHTYASLHQLAERIRAVQAS